MVAHWQSVIAPLLEAAAPRTIVEIGVRMGTTSARLLDYAARTRAVVHGIDPKPLPEAEALAAEHPQRFVLHRGLSLDVLPGLGGIDCALIDGDHNWYTVIHELRLLAAAAEEHFPLIFAHDVCWPYGRRDMYYDPETIPAEYRQPYRHGGVLPGRRRLANADEGLYSGTVLAEREGTPRNGVLTAIEDFVAEHESELALKVVPGFLGLAVLMSGERLRANPALAEQLARLDSPDFLRNHCERLEQARHMVRVKNRRAQAITG